MKRLLLFLACAWPALAAPSQKELAEELGKLATLTSCDLDDQGNVIRLAFSNKSNTDPGIDDETIKRLAAFPKLEAVFLDKQPLSDAGYAWLKNLPELTDLRIHYANFKFWTDNGKQPAIATADFALAVNEIRKPLKILQLKHLFQINGECWARIRPQPELEHLEIDNEFAGPAAVPFIKAAPKIRNLQLHRTSLNDAELGEIIRSLPELEVLLVRPQGSPASGGDPLSGATFRALKDHPKLRVLFFEGEFADEDLDVLATVPNLIFASFKFRGGADSPGLQKLLRERPNLQLKAGSHQLGPRHWPPKGQHSQDESYRWGITY